MVWEMAAAFSGFLGAFILGTFVEYLFHRLMHVRFLLGKKHAEHHRDGWGQGFLGEFWDYVLGSMPILAAGVAGCVFLLDSWPAGIGFVAGGLAYAILAAYAHQVQHENPELVFWLPRPVHYLHHHHHMWKHNFGILVDFWDRVFGTYQKMEWNPQRKPRDFPLKSFFQIKWY